MLGYACSSRNEAAVALLLKHRDIEPGNNATIGAFVKCVVFARRVGDDAATRIFKMLISHPKVDLVSTAIDDQLPALYCFAAKASSSTCHADCTRVLIDSGKVDVNARWRMNATPFEVACLNGNERFVRCMLDCPAFDVTTVPDGVRAAKFMSHDGVVATIARHRSVRRAKRHDPALAALLSDVLAEENE